MSAIPSDEVTKKFKKQLEELSLEEIKTKLIQNIWGTNSWKSKIANDFIKETENKEIKNIKEKTLKTAEASNKIAKEANKLSEEANQIARKAKNQAKCANWISVIALLASAISLFNLDKLVYGVLQNILHFIQH